MQTLKLYDTHPYDTDFEAEILESTTESGMLSLVLDRTLFFPEEGGQTPDKGTVTAGGKTYDISDVQITGGVIRHKVAGSFDRIPEELGEGSKVRGKICWPERFSNMQNHTGEHILSGLMHSLYGFDNVGFHLSRSTVTLDVNGFLSDEELADLERRANSVVWANVPVRGEYPAPEVLKTLEYRSKKEIEGAVRIVTIEGVDACACCAPHVGKTGEIGLIKILKVMREKSKMRLQILCGGRALSEMQRRQNVLDEISHMVSEPPEETARGVLRLQEENGQLKYRMNGMAMKYMDLLTAAVPERQMNVFLFEEKTDVQILRRGVNALCAKGIGFAGIFSGSDEEGWFYILGRCPRQEPDEAEFSNLHKKDLKVLNKEFLSRLDGKGGGSAEMVQGSIRSGREEILAALKYCTAGE